MKPLLFLILLASPLFAQQTTQQFCDGQQGAVDVLTPIINQFAGYIVPPAGATTADVQTAAKTLVRVTLGEKCVMMRLGDQLAAMSTSLAALQQQVAALQSQLPTVTAQSSSAVTTANAAAQTVSAMQANVTKLQSQVKNASSALQ